MEAQITHLISSIEDAYVDLWVAHGEYRTLRQARDASLDLWQQIVHNADSSESMLKQKTAARDRYFEYRAQLKQALQLMRGKERRLRASLELAADDGRMIVPAGLPDRSPPHITPTEWGEMMDKAHSNSPTVQQQTAVVRQCELQPMSRESTEVSPESGNERGRGSELLNHVRHVARERARLESLKLHTSLLLTTRVLEWDFYSRSLQSHRKRRTAAENEMHALSELDSAGKLNDITLLLDAQRRWVAACSDCLTACAGRFSATSDLHMRQGTLLEYHRLLLDERMPPQRHAEADVVWPGGSD